MRQCQVDLSSEQRPRAQPPRQTLGQAGARRAGFRRRRDHDHCRAVPYRAACLGHLDSAVAGRANIAGGPLRRRDHQCCQDQDRKRCSNERNGAHCLWRSSARYLRAKRNASSTSTLPGVLSRAVHCHRRRARSELALDARKPRRPAAVGDIGKSHLQVAVGQRDDARGLDAGAAERFIDCRTHIACRYRRDLRPRAQRFDFVQQRIEFGGAARCCGRLRSSRPMPL